MRRLEVWLELDGVHEDGLAGGADEALLSAPSQDSVLLPIFTQQDNNDIEPVSRQNLKEFADQIIK